MRCSFRRIPDCHCQSTGSCNTLLPAHHFNKAMAAAASTTSVSTYLGEIGRIAILSKDQQLIHCKRIRRWLDWPDGRDAAPESVKRAGRRSMNRMVESNLRMVVSLAKKYNNQGVPLEDLIQEGNIGLLTACEKFDPERGYCFSTFSYWWIRQGMTRYLANSSRLIRIPCNTSELSRKLRRAQADWQVVHGRLPTLEELAEATNQPVPRIKLALQATIMQPRSLDQLIHENGSPLGDMIATIDDETHEQQLERQMQEELVTAAMAKLPDLERLTLEGVVFQKLTHREVAQQLKLSVTRVGQLQRAATQRLRNLLLIDQSVSSSSNTNSSTRHERVRMTVTAPGSAPSARVNLSYENVVIPA